MKTVNNQLLEITCIKCNQKATEPEKYVKERGAICRSCFNKRAAIFYHKNKHLHIKERSIAASKAHLKKKETAIQHYSPTMTCQWEGCGWNDLRALTIDHINGSGIKHRKTIGKKAGWHFYAWLIKQGFPEGYQVLCMNHQFIKRIVNHELRKRYL